MRFCLKFSLKKKHLFKLLKYYDNRTLFHLGGSERKRARAHFTIGGDSFSHRSSVFQLLREKKMTTHAFILTFHGASNRNHYKIFYTKCVYHLTILNHQRNVKCSERAYTSLCVDECYECIESVWNSVANSAVKSISLMNYIMKERVPFNVI